MQPELLKLPVVHRGLCVHRTKPPTKEQLDAGHGYDHGEIERALMLEWEDRNDPDKFGPNGLQELVSQCAKSGRLPRGLGSPELTARDAAMVAEVIQWLGTNCGLGFLHSAFHRAGYTFKYEEQESARKRWMRNYKAREHRRKIREEKANRPVKRRFSLMED